MASTTGATTAAATLVGHRSRWQTDREPFSTAANSVIVAEMLLDRLLMLFGCVVAAAAAAVGASLLQRVAKEDAGEGGKEAVAMLLRPRRLDLLLAMPMRDVPNLMVMLRQRHMHADADNAYTRWFLERSGCPLTMATYDNEAATTTQSELANRDSFVVVTELLQLSATIRRFVQSAGVFFFIVTDAHNGTDTELMLDTLHQIWSRHSAFRNYMLTPRGILIYDPFAYDEQRTRYGLLVVHDPAQSLERALFSDMRGYPLRIQIFKSVYARPKLNATTKRIERVDSVDGKVANLLQQRMNFSMQLQEPDSGYFGERDANGTYNGAIGSIINKQIDLCLTGFFVKDYMVPELDFSVAVYDDRLCIYVPKAKRIPQSILPVFSVRCDVWLGFILTAFACGSIWWAMRRLNLWLGVAQISNARGVLEPSLKMQFARIYIDTWVVWVRVNVVHFPPFHSERVFVVSLCLVSVIFGAIFESSLATVYIHPLYYKDIQTLRELDDSGLKVIYKYTSMADDLFFSQTSQLFASLNKKLTHVSNLNEDVIRDIATYGGKASVSRYSSLMLESLHFIIEKRIWVVPECPKYYTISYVMRKDSPWDETINNLLLRFLNAGLINKWIAEAQTEMDITIMKAQRFGTGDTFKVLTVSDLQLAFYVVLMGNTLAAMSLAIEYYLKGWSTPRRRRDAEQRQQLQQPQHQ